MSLAYDPALRLYQVAGAATTRFAYDGLDRIAEYDGAGAIKTRYGWGPGVDEPILADTGGALNCSGTRFLHSDEQGSIIGPSRLLRQSHQHQRL